MKKNKFQATKSKKRNILTCCCSCISEKPETIQQTQITNITKEDNDNALDAIEEEDKITNKKQEEHDKEHNEKVIKSILTKYLALKRAEQLKTELPTVSDPRDFKSIKTINQSDTLKVEYCSENQTLSESNKSVASTPLLRACKSKSAPTTSIAHDSFADFYQKMYKSEESSKIVEPKKLELIFKKSSYNRESSSNNSLQYKISCNKNSSDCYSSSIQESRKSFIRNERKKSRATVKQVLLNPSIEGEFSEKTNSSGSLKWKLIISHRDQNKGDFM